MVQASIPMVLTGYGGINMKYYKLINRGGWVLSNDYCEAAEMVIGYGGIWTKDHRRAKRFKSEKEVQAEVNKMPGDDKYLMVSNKENWKKAYYEWTGNKL